MKNASSFTILFKCESELNTFFALACIIAFTTVHENSLTIL